MGRRRRRRKVGKMSVVYISVIVSLSLMGVGYGYWSEGLQMGVNITTGNIDPTASADGSSTLNIISSDDNRNLYISGEMYQGSYEDILIKILDKGSIPVKLEEISIGGNSEISDLHSQSMARYGLLSFSNDDVVEEFNLSIIPPKNDTEDITTQMFLLSIEEDQEEGDEIQRRIDEIYEEINEIQQEIDRLNVTERHNFRYDLRFVQGI